MYDEGMKENMDLEDERADNDNKPALTVFYQKWHFWGSDAQTCHPVLTSNLTMHSRLTGKGDQWAWLSRSFIGRMLAYQTRTRVCW